MMSALKDNLPPHVRTTYGKVTGETTAQIEMKNYIEAGERRSS